MARVVGTLLSTSYPVPSYCLPTRRFTASGAVHEYPAFIERMNAGHPVPSAGHTTSHTISRTADQAIAKCPWQASDSRLPPASSLQRQLIRAQSPFGRRRSPAISAHPQFPKSFCMAARAESPIRPNTPERQIHDRAARCVTLWLDLVVRPNGCPPSPNPSSRIACSCVAKGASGRRAIRTTGQ